MNYHIIDLHCDSIMYCMEDGMQLRDMDTHINLAKLREGGSLVQCFALFIRTNESAKKHGLDKYSAYELYQMMLKTFKEQIAKNSDLIEQVYSSEEIKAKKDKGKLLALLTVEDSAPVEGRIERYDELYADGVRMMSLTWNYENCVAFPCSADPVLHHCRGLKPFGFEALEKMNSLGIIADTSHLSERGFWDVVEHCKKPFVSSHSCARALCSHQRNLTDQQLKALADKGGMVGINFCGGFLEDGNFDNASIETVVKHLVHMKNVVGAEAIGWGSDFDGIETKLEWKDFSGMPLLVDALRPHFSEDELEKLCYKNFLRVMKDNEA
ncbi:MAG TPA: dipeptidase [Bacillota bacterium]|nr:dipeptidase [Bacillota bacterium]HQC35502.1 dipeptidase [Bacillota bacterium]